MTRIRRIHKAFLLGTTYYVIPFVHFKMDSLNNRTESHDVHFDSLVSDRRAVILGNE